jgi:hypothetical protein
MNQVTRLGRIVLPALLAGATLLVCSVASAGNYMPKFRAGHVPNNAVQAPAYTPRGYSASGVVPRTAAQSRAAGNASAHHSSAAGRSTVSPHTLPTH